MKKKLFLAFAISVILVCLFAISISAAEYFGDVEIIDLDKDGVSDISINDRLPSIVDGEGPTASKNARATIKCSCEAKTHTFPAYYLASPISTGTRFYCFSYGDLNNLLPQYCGATEAIDGTYITAYEIPNGYTAIYSGFFYDGSTYAGKSIKYFNFNTCPTMTSLEGTSSARNWFTDSSIEAIDIGTSFQTLPVMFLYNCDNLSSVTIPDSVVTIDRLAIYGCAKLKNIIFTENSSLTTLNANALSDNPMLEGLYLPSGLTKLGVSGSNQSPFQGNTNMYLLNSPDETTKPKIYYVPDGIASIEGEVFKNCKNLNDIIVFNENITSISDGWAFCNANAVTLVFLGDVTELSTTGSAWAKQTAIYFCNEADTEYTGNANVASKFVYCHAEGNTQHLHNPRANETTLPTCTDNSVSKTYCFCGADMGSVVNEDTALGHDDTDAVVIMYFANNNYFENATSEYTCKRCEEAIKSEIENSALFTKKGITVPENEKATSICHAITVNNKAIEDYNAYLGESNAIKYGVVVGKATESGTPVNAQGTSSGDAIVVGFEGTNYSFIQAKITNVPVETGLYCSAYVVDAGVVTYLYEGSVTSTAQVISISAENATLPEATVPSNDEE